MSDFLVTYASQYGHTKRYAETLAKALNADCMPIRTMTRADAEKHTAILFGGAVYAGSVLDFKDFAALHTWFPGKLLLFVVGMTDPANESNAEQLKATLRQALPDLDSLPIFFLRGGLDFSKMRFLHKAVLRMISASIRKKANPTAEETAMLNAFGQTCDFYTEDALQPILDAAKAL